MRRITAGIIGMGFVGPIHMEALKRLNFVDVAIASSTADKAKQAAERFHVAKAFGDWRDLVNDPEIEVIHICAPNHLHYPIAKMALSLGKHVVCDKPLTLDLAESEELVKLAHQAGVVNAVTFNMAFYPLVQHAKEMLKTNQLGRVNFVQGYYLQDWLLYETDYNWRVEARYQGASRVVGDIGVHCLHMLQEMLGQKVVRIFANLNTIHQTRKKPAVETATYSRADHHQGFEEVRIDTEDQATLLLEFSGGARGVFTGGQVFAGRKNRIGWEIYGSEKSLAWNGEEPNQLWIGNRSTGNQVLMKDAGLVDPHIASLCVFPGGLQEGYSETWRSLMRNIYQAVLEGRPNRGYPDFADGLAIQRVVAAAVESNRSNRWISINY